MAAPVLVARGLLPAGLPAGADSQPLDLTLEPGTICCIVGPPSSGKTAWLRTLAAVDPPAAGELTLAGQDAVHLNRVQWLRLRRHVAYVGAGAPLLSVVRALANVTLAAHYHQIDGNEAIRAKALSLLGRIGWRGPLDALPAYLDDYQRLLLALARCLILDPSLLFLHEPFRMMDVSGWRSFGSVLVGLAHEGGLAQVVATQHLPFVRRCADRILFVGGGPVREFSGWAEFSTDAGTPVQDFLESSGADQRADA